ncbi:hypothetical protein SLEP1_g42981 [Rubroshorea leprosula]|uniref:Leucine-rich repeat-containing N-terminal plant-type domain-containing protein n=1 Tax=Rubroshorea leprosula TaxID=152421 RepID=A0AAV5LBK1_9ROSI|nr:hypothetical protein SLEP1_g42981 [Rubroshorea leprosula]
MKLPLHFLLPLLLLSTLLCLSSSELCHPEDKKVLLDIKKAFNDPYVLSSWDPKADCCHWLCVECDPTSHRIITLTIMADNKISGPIPPQIPVGGKLQRFDYSSYFHNRCLCGAPLPSCK